MQEQLAQRVSECTRLEQTARKQRQQLKTFNERTATADEEIHDQKTMIGARREGGERREGGVKGGRGGERGGSGEGVGREGRGFMCASITHGLWQTTIVYTVELD